VEKTCEDSRTTIQYLFTSDAQLREAYSDSYGEVLIGKVFEDLDALAGLPNPSSSLHPGPNSTPYADSNPTNPNLNNINPNPNPNPNRQETSP